MAEITNTKLDRMRYTKDKRSSMMVLLAIVFNVLYFVSIYQQDMMGGVASPAYPYYTWMIGASVIVNLLFLLIGFLCSEGVKGRKSGYPVALLVIGLFQIGRIFYLPAKVKDMVYSYNNVEYQVMSDGQYTFAIIMLLISGILCILAGINSYLNSKKLATYMKTIES